MNQILLDSQKISRKLEAKSRCDDEGRLRILLLTTAASGIECIDPSGFGRSLGIESR